LVDVGWSHVGKPHDSQAAEWSDDHHGQLQDGYVTNLVSWVAEQLICLLHCICMSFERKGIIRHLQIDVNLPGLKVPKHEIGQSELF